MAGIFQFTPRIRGSRGIRIGVGRKLGSPIYHLEQGDQDRRLGGWAPGIPQFTPMSRGNRIGVGGKLHPNPPAHPVLRCNS